MSFLSSLDISGSGLTASRLRMDVISENIANSTTTRTENGGPYRRKLVVYEPAQQSSFQHILTSKLQEGGEQMGVKVSKIAEDPSDFTPVYDPSNPDANAQGYVMMPNVDPIKETIDMMSVTRAYDANLTAFNAVKGMAVKALELGR
ncbi:flagellar basal body rod protein FlgC [Caproiciproducens galactitolivorans]|uniref:Flagellar basal-body rod protein FlgC n=1 Tax=Caproiciproducens galactitolivorans TaxID=642589 RepID=A0ABT4BSW6_9FIRM|nr:flagellar basal body rod protein FlgC [Caproiciproducens galactitolivorans]MCY1713023.1 flagellar basal body rod protein FlgC [Caproiciproducens galactitolivorans]